MTMFRGDDLQGGGWPAARAPRRVPALAWLLGVLALAAVSALVAGIVTALART